MLDELKLKTSDCESIFIETTFPDKSILRNSKKLLVGCVYRHPRYNTEHFISELFSKLDGYSSSNKTPILLMGDINIDIGNI